jgi:hypothetical protein
MYIYTHNSASLQTNSIGGVLTLLKVLWIVETSSADSPSPVPTVRREIGETLKLSRFVWPFDMRD